MGRLKSSCTVKDIVWIFWIQCLITTTTTGQQLETQYVGCFYDVAGSQSFTTTPEIERHNLTIGSCINHCRNTISRKTYAGLQNGRVCSCRDDYGEQLPDINCRAQCAGNASQYCGGNGPSGQVSSYSVYTVCPVGYFGIDCDKPCHCKDETPCHRITGNCSNGCSGFWSGQSCDKTSSLAYDYLGCFLDKGDRAFQNQHSIYNNHRNECIRKCTINNNYPYIIGLQYGRECFCGDNRYDKHGQINEVKCNMECPGDRSQKCGGSYANSVHRLVCPIGYYGPKCISRCNCANSVSCSRLNGSCPDVANTSQNKCRQGWTGDACNQRDCAVHDCGSDETCETINLGYASVSVCRCQVGFYRSGKATVCTERILQDQYIGCYKINIMKEVELMPRSDLTIALCIRHCHDQHPQKKTFAGLRNGDRCVCGDDSGNFQEDSDCQTVCNGNQLQYCGGKETYAVYTVCPIGYYGTVCGDSCHCKGQFPCNRQTGECPDGCMRNWNGPSCNRTTTQYIGCYLDGNKDKAMESSNPGGKTGYSRWGIGKNTIEFCISICAEYNLTYAGMQYGYDCNCGDSYNRYGPKPENRCDFPCPSNRSQKCGGDHANSVYSVCPVGTYGPNCANKCNCANEESCIYRNGTCPSGRCKPGWTGGQCNVKDLFERWWCTDDKDCVGSNETCQYIQLKYTNTSRCRCKYGFRRNKPWDLCKDVDECLLNLTNCQPKSEDCINTVGSYECICKPGLNRTTPYDQCQDIDECILSPCHQYENCTNSWGSYSCDTCKEGFHRNSSNQNSTCSDIDECTDLVNYCGENAINCDNTVGHYSCDYCSEGFFVRDGSCVTASSGGGPLMGIVVGIVVVLLLFVLMVFLILYLRKRQRRENGPSIVDIYLPKEPKFNNAKKPTERNITGQDTHIETEECINLSTTDSRAPVIDFPKLLKLKKLAAGGLKREFEIIPIDDKTKSCTEGKKREMKTRNRFQNIIPYDQNRVRLLKLNKGNALDYINASYIISYNKSEKLIATQGPTPSTPSTPGTVHEFWRMIYENNVDVIVMITNLVENGKKKCACYWPDSAESLDLEGGLSVRIKQTEKRPNYVRRDLQLIKDREVLLIRQWHFTTWPDHGVPTDVKGFLSFRRKVLQSSSPDKYTLVHCSAGVGRTGTFIAINYLLEQAEADGFVDVPGCLRDLREQRQQMVQTLDQYEFIYAALSIEFILGNTVMPIEDFDNCLRKMKTGKTRLAVQFEVLEEQIQLTDESENPFRVIPKDGAVLNARYDINAVFVQSWKTKDAYIVAECPSKQAIDYFWNICLDYDCNMIILIGDIPPSAFFFPVESGGSLFLRRGRVQLEANAKRSYGSFRKLKLFETTECDYANSDVLIERGRVTLLQVDVTSTAKMHLSLDYARLRDVNNAIKDLTTAENANADSRRSRILILSQPESNLGGFFVAALNAFDMIAEENEVDIYQIVKDIKKSRSQLFSGRLDQYDELHNVVSQHIKNTSSTSDVYANL